MEQLLIMAFFPSLISLVALVAFFWYTLNSTWVLDVVDKWVGVNPGRVYIACGAWLIAMCASFVAVYGIVLWLQLNAFGN